MHDQTKYLISFFPSSISLETFFLQQCLLCSQLNEHSVKYHYNDSPYMTTNFCRSLLQIKFCIVLQVEHKSLEKHHLFKLLLGTLNILLLVGFSWDFRLPLEGSPRNTTQIHIIGWYRYKIQYQDGEPYFKYSPNRGCVCECVHLHVCFIICLAVMFVCMSTCV